MKRIFKLVISLTIFCCFFFLLGFLKNYHLPRIKTWVLIEIEKYSDKNLPITIWPQNVELDYFPLQVSFTNIKVLPKSKLKSQIAPFTVERMSASLNWWSLLSGKLRISNLQINKTSIKAIINTQDHSSTQKPSETKRPFLDFSFLQDIPIDDISLNDIDLLFKIKPQNIAAKITHLHMELNNLSNRLRVHFSSKNIALKKHNEDSLLSVNLSTNFVFDPREIVVTALKIKKKNSFLVGTSLIRGNILQGDFDYLEAKMRSDLLLPEVVKFSSDLIPHIKLPKLKGSLQSDFDIVHNFNSETKVKFQLEAHQLIIDQYRIGNAILNGKLINDLLTIDQGVVQHSSGKLTVSEFLFDIKKEYFRTNLDIKNIQVHNFLNSIHVTGVPIELPIDADLPCYGKFKPHFLVTCKGIANIQNAAVWDDLEKKFNIVSMNKIQLIGKFTVSSSKVNYETQIQINQSKGFSRGEINFNKGFHIDYQGHLKNLKKDIPNLANLNLEGSAKIKGKTWGNSKWGRIQFNLNGKSMWLDNFGLGNPNLELSYKKGVISFRNISATQGNSRFKGNLSINLPMNLIRVDATSPFLDAEDLLYLFSRKVQLPVKIMGSGSAKFFAKGPLNFNYLSYQLETSLFRGSIAKENFDQFVFNVESKNGFVESKEIQINKADSRIHLKGRVNPQGLLDAVILGEKLRLEQSEHLSDLGFNLGGQLDFTMAMVGPILSPDTELHGRLSKMLIAERAEPDSSFWLRFNSNSLEGKAKFIGNVLQTEFKLPYNKNTPFRLYLKTDKWNFAQLFNVFSGSDIQNDYFTQLSTEIMLDSPQNWFWDSTGHIEISNLKLSKGESYLENAKPMALRFNKGVMNTHQFRLDGPSNFLELKSNNSQREYVDLALNGKFNLELISLVTPFLDDLRGIGSLALNIKGPVENPDILGSSYIQNAYVKLKGLPHAFEKVTSDLLFNQNDLLINSIKSEFANGQLVADGHVNFLSLKKIPIDIKAQIKNAKLNIPDGFSTEGQANLYIKGDFIPYTLGGSYEIDRGNIKLNLASDASNSKKIQPSDFLPKFLVKESTDPLLLNMNITMNKPLNVTAMVPEAKIDTKISGNMMVRGSPLHPSLQGLIRSQPGGTMLFRSNQFDIVSATIEYNNQPPSEPDLQVTAKANIRSKSQSNEVEATGEEYEVTLDIQGNAKNPQINLFSNPLLSENDIVSLLAFGITSANYQQLDSDQQAVQSGVEVGAQFVKQQLGITKAVENTIGLNLDISSVIDDENTAAPRISVSRQFTPKFGMSFSRTQGKAPSNQMRFEYRFNDKLSVVGQMQRQDAGTATERDDTIVNQERVGLDLEYKFQFK